MAKDYEREEYLEMRKRIERLDELLLLIAMCLISAILIIGSYFLLRGLF